ncbi:MAG: hypothetical protein R3F31_18955 [Verrucomicrobiales bacterium]
MRKKVAKPFHPAVRIGLTVLSVLAFLALLVGSARLGVVMALQDLPDSARHKKGYQAGVELRAGQDGGALYFAESVQALRDFYFRYPSEDARQKAEAESQGIRRVFGRPSSAPFGRMRIAFWWRCFQDPLPENSGFTKASSRSPIGQNLDPSKIRWRERCH